MVRYATCEVVSVLKAPLHHGISKSDLVTRLTGFVIYSGSAAETALTGNRL